MIRKSIKSKEDLEAFSRCSKVNIFTPLIVKYDFSSSPLIADFKPYRNSQWSDDVLEVGIVRNFPVIFRDDGTPWDLGNLYLIYKFHETARLDTPNIGTLTSISNHLTMYLRYIEHCQKKASPIHELYFPENAYERVTYRYHRYLKQLLRKNPQPISLGVAKARMGAVINFYKGLTKWNLIAESNLDNSPYENRVVGIPYSDHLGITHIKEIETTDISFRSPRKNVDNGFINDGGKLRPLTEEEQQIVFKALKENGNRTLQLIFWVAIFTGARKQTICTLRIKDLKNLMGKRLNEQNEVLIKVGEGTDIDVKLQNKYGKNYRLHMPHELAQILIEYTNSPQAIERRKKSFYGDNDDNYLFLNKNGSPYYTSTKEQIDRLYSKNEIRISLKNMGDFPIVNGQAITNFVNRLNQVILSQHPNFIAFRFHDLRATYGMNYVRDSLNAGVKPSLVLNMLKARMGHSNINTTMIYLNFDDFSAQIDTLSLAHFNRLSSYVLA